MGRQQRRQPKSLVEPGSATQRANDEDDPHYDLRSQHDGPHDGGLSKCGGKDLAIDDDGKDSTDEPSTRLAVSNATYELAKTISTALNASSSV